LIVALTTLSHWIAKWALTFDPFCASLRITSINKLRENIGQTQKDELLQCGPMPNVMAALPNKGGAL